MRIISQGGHADLPYEEIALCIDCEDTILETDAGAKYLESKYTFDSLFINK